MNMSTKNETEEGTEPTAGMTLFEDVADALFDSVGIYGVTCLREYARKNAGKLEGKLKGDPAVLKKIHELPVGRLEMLDIFLENAEQIQKVMDIKY